MHSSDGSPTRVCFARLQFLEQERAKMEHAVLGVAAIFMVVILLLGWSSLKEGVREFTNREEVK